MIETTIFNTDAEQAIIGTCIINNIYFAKVADILESKHFYHREHKVLWEHFVKIASEVEVINSITLKGFLDSHEAFYHLEGSKYISQLLGSASSIIDIRNYGLLLIDLWKKRELEKVLTNCLENLGKKQSDWIFSELENEIAGIDTFSPKKKTDHVSKIVSDLKIKRDLKIQPKIIPSGFKLLDQKLNGGFYSKQLAVIGARTAVGKTTLLQDIIIRSSRLGKSCLFISLEVDAERVALKFLSNIASVGAWKIKRNILSGIEFENLQKAEKELTEMDIFLNDSGDLKFRDIERIIKNQLQKKPVDLVAIDYIQHIKFENDKNLSATMEISKNVVALKAMAQNYDVAVVAAAQINRAGTEKPTLAHFEGSSAIEKNADVAIIIHREELDEKEREGSYYSESGVFIVAKNRDGKTGEIAFRLDGEFGRFTEINL